MNINNNTLPLLYLKAKTIRILLLTKSKEECGRNPDKIDLNHAALNPDMMVFKCDSISITPQVENSLSRILVNPELFHMSRGILSIPGSHIEDRQYQMDALGLGLFTGRWCDIERKSEKRLKPLLKTMGENPALEWNDGTLTNEADKRVDEVFLMPSLAPFDLQITFAPAIVYNPFLIETSKSKANNTSSSRHHISVGPPPKLIAGISLEVNAKSEIVFTISLNQIRLMSLFVQETITLYNSLLFPGTMIRANDMAKETRKGVADSGVDDTIGGGGGTSAEKAKPPEEALMVIDDQMEIAKKIFPKFVPTEVLITGSKISLILFKLSEGDKSGVSAEDKAMWRRYRYKQRRHEIMKDRAAGQNVSSADLESEEAFQSSDWPQDQHTKISASVGVARSEQKTARDQGGYDASEEGSMEDAPELIVKIFPLIHHQVKQPHIFISYSTQENCRFELSCYDASLSMSPVNYFITCGGHRVPGPLDYQNHLFQTKLGEADKKSGIPPALLTVAAMNFVSSETAKLSCKVERPIKVFCNISLWQQFLTILYSVKGSCGLSEIVQLTMALNQDKPHAKNIQTTLVDDEKHKALLLLRTQLSSIRSISLETKQLVASLSTEVHPKISTKGHRNSNVAEISLGLAGVSLTCSYTSKVLKKHPRLVTEIQTTVLWDKLVSRMTIGLYSHRFFGPCSLTTKVKIAWQDLSMLEEAPNLIVKFCSDWLPIYVGPNHLIAFQKLNEYLVAQFASTGSNPDSGEGSIEDKEATEKSSLSSRKEANYTALEGAKISPSIQHPNAVEQHYIDDLRAGAFQYVDESKDGHNNSGEGNEPKPYQIVFTKQPPAMTWRYPQARTLTRVSVFPLPLKSASEFGTSDLGECGITCALQYMERCTNSYRTYSEFYLSENEVNHLDLPLVGDIKKMVMSSTWRVVIFNSEDECEDFDQPESKIIVTPKSLASVVRVDSYLNQALLPRIHASMDISKISISFHNHLHFCGYALPLPLGSRFTLDQVFPLDQKVANMHLNGNSFGLDVWLPPSGFQANVRIESSVQMDFVDYSFLATHQLLFPTKVELLCFTQKKDEHPMSIEARIHGKKVMVRLGHFATRFLSKSVDIWNSALKNFTDDTTAARADSAEHTSGRKKALEPVTDFVICNNTQDSIRFGQVDTEENILLRPSEAHMYAWRSQRTRLQLRLCVEGLGYWRWCEPFSLRKDNNDNSSIPIATNNEAQVRSIDHGTHVTTLLVTMTQLNPHLNSCQPLQYQVMVSGLISTASLLRDHLEVRAVLHKSGAALAAAATVSSTSTHDHHQQQHRTILGSFCVAPSFLLQPEYIQGIKIRLLGIGTPWSGDIPLNIEKGRRNSVLVRVPLKEKGQCLTIWCRVVEEKLINDGISRCLLIFSPMYMSRSLLPNPISLLVYNTSSQSQPTSSVGGSVSTKDTFAYEMPLPGREEAVQMETTGTSDQKYSLYFQVVQGLPPSDPVAMSWGTIERIRDKNYEAPSIDEILSNISSYRKGILPNRGGKPWPYTDDGIDVDEWLPSVQPRTDVKVRFVQLHPLCNTLCVEVVPWCLFVNLSGISIIVKDTGPSSNNKEASAVNHITNRSVFVPPSSILKSTFHLGLLDEDGKEWFGPTLQMTEQQWHFKRSSSFLMPSMDGMIPLEGFTQTHIVCGAQICFLTVQSNDHQGIRVISLKATFSISNCLAKEVLCASLFSSKAEGDAFHLDSANYAVQDIPSSVAQTTDGGTVRADPFLFWQLVDFDSTSSLDVFQQKLVFSSLQRWSSPLSLEDCKTSDQDVRHSVSLASKRAISKTEPKDPHEKHTLMNELMFVSLHQKDGRIFIVLQPDHQPQFIIHNSLNVPLYFMENHLNSFQAVQPNMSYMYSSKLASDNLCRVESIEKAIKMAFSTGLVQEKDNAWEEVADNGIVASWSEWFDVSS